MASVASSHMILFVASMIVAAGVAGTFVDSVSEVSAAIDDRSLDISREVRTDIEVISDPTTGVYDGNGTVTLYVKNTGSSRLRNDSAAVDVVLDGRYRTGVTVTVVDGTAWDEHSVARIEISVTLAPGDHRVRLSVNGDRELFRFRT
jgi:flagellar protein FlaG